MRRAETPVLSTCHALSRRAFLLTSALLGGAVGTGLLRTPPALAEALTRAQRDSMTPAEILAMFKDGNQRFQNGERKQRSYRDEQRTSAAGQYPAAVLLSCIDSRAPAEIIFDVGIGDLFNCRVAGNAANDDILGSMEFACAVAGAKVVLVMGHTSCGAIKGAIDGVDLGHLTGLLAKIRPAIAATQFTGERSSGNPSFVDAVARKNVELTLAQIRERSPILRDLEQAKKLEFAGAMYDLKTAQVTFLA